MSQEIDILKIRTDLESCVRDLTNGYTRLQISHFEEQQKQNSEIIKLTNNNKDLLDELELKKDNIDLLRNVRYEEMINSQNDKISILEQEEGNSQKVSIQKTSR